jgi:2-polyprenyl-6-hydroxyphenyl methylase/3-demethylubiquinone-9 3-methyltransferase
MTDAGQARRRPADDPFVEYYAAASESPATRARFAAVQSALLRVRRRRNFGEPAALDVLDVGCGAGTQALMWARDGHRVHGIDINDALVRLGRERCAAAGVQTDLRTGNATELPWSAASMDVCIAPELLEHVPDWQRCLDEMTRVLRDDGQLYVSTTNVLCPKQDEFDLPAYSWYPSAVKRHFERRAVTDRPELVNHAKFPAVNWFSVYSLSAALRQRGFDVLDRFDLIDDARQPALARAALAFVRAVPPARWFGHVLTSGLWVVGIKRPQQR